MDWSFLKPDVKFMFFFKNITVMILLQITELLLEPVFICECNEYRVCFVVMYFTIPAIAFTAFAWSLRKDYIFMKICKCCGENTGTSRDAGDNYDIDCCKKYINSPCCQRTCRLLSFCKTLYPAFCWGVILLIDGKYAGCALYSKCNSTMTIVDTKDPDMVHGMIRSKIWGLTVVAVFVLFYLIYLCGACCCRSPVDRYREKHMSKLEKGREKFARKYAKTCSERRAESCEKQLKEAISQTRAGNQTSSGAASGGDPEHIELLNISGAAGGGELVELDPKTIVNIIEKHFSITY